VSYKILFLNWQCIKHPLGGGAEVYHHEILKRLATQGHSVTWLCSHYKALAHEETIDGIRIVRTGGRNWFNFAAPAACRRLLKTKPYDIVIDSINKIPLMTPLYSCGKPVLAYVHHLFRKTIFRETILPFALYVYLTEKMVPAVYRRIPFCAVSESTRNDLQDFGIGKDRITIIENCVDHELYRPDPAKLSPGPLIGYLGRIKKYKSVDHLILAFERVRSNIPGARLVIVGDGDNLPELKILARNLGLSDAVEFTGFLSAERKVEILQQCTVVGNPSIKEGWGLTVIEANACGTPVIAADVQGLRDSVVDGKTGFLYPYGDIDRLADLLQNVLINAELRGRLSAHALEWASGFNWDTNAAKTLDLIEQTIENSKTTKK